MTNLLSVTGGFCKRARFVLMASLIVSLMAGTGYGQSTFGSILGTVHDPSGAVVTRGLVTITNAGTSARRSTSTDQNGSYTVTNLEPGTYRIAIEAPGFQVATYSTELQARQTVRIDGQMAVAAQAQSVEVVGEAAPTINTEVSNIAETKTGRELVDLPVAIATRGSGSTSPMSTLTTQPGVQTDSSGNISVAGTKPSMLQMSIDGVSSMGPRTNGPLTELFPSFNSIAEIRVSETNNAAEFGGVSDITTISKSGANSFHGGVFENLQNTDLNARNPFNAVKPVVKMNDFGAYGGGRIWRDRTFFFASYEGLRLPKQTTLVESVPSLALRNGDLSAYSKPVYAPGTGVPYTGNQIPATDISQVSLNALKYLFPIPNTGAPNAIANNYVQNMPTPISSNQADLRLDQIISTRQTLFVRGSYKKRSVEVAPSPGGSPTPTGSALLGPFSTPEIDFGFTAAYNFIIKPSLVNEARVGFNGNHTATTFGASPAQVVSEIGLTGLPPLPSGNAVPNFAIAGFQQTGGSNSTRGRNGTFQILDNLTWTNGRHTLKFGGDYRYLTGHSENVYANFRLGRYNFNGAVTGVAGAANAYIGNPYAAFLLGIPDKTFLDTVVEDRLNGYDPAYAFYFQDDFKVTPRLTINYGIRYELHPKFYDHYLNISNFLPDVQTIVNGQSILGAVVIPNQEAFKILSPDFAASIAPTPIITAQQAGLPENLHYTNKADFGPRIGFAWRATADGKTVIRGGYGRFIEVPLGTLLGAGYAIHSADQGFFNNSIVNGQPTLMLPHAFPSNLAQPGSQFFQQASDLHYKEAVVHQWNFTMERDLGFNTGLRVSYTGSHGSDMGVQVDLGQVAPNTIGFAAASKFLKYPLFGEVESEVNGGVQNYHSLTVAVNKRFSRGLQFLTSYTFSKNLTDAQGWNPSAFATEAGGVATNTHDFMLDYGNVAFSRRHRFLSTFLYQLPFGKQGLVMKKANSIVNGAIGGWELAGYLMFQSGPFLTVTVPGADPSGTGFPQITGDGRADTVSGVPVYPASQSIRQWLNPAAFAVPPNNIGRFPTSPVGGFVGPGTQSVSMSLMKAFSFTEAMRLQVGAQAANLFNHPNYATPNTSFNTAAFGTISNVQSAEGAGPRVVQLTARFTF